MALWDRILQPEVLGILMVFIVPVTGIICGSIIMITKQRSVDEMKRMMIEQGRSAEEIDRVIRAGADKDTKKREKLD